MRVHAALRCALALPFIMTLVFPASSYSASPRRTVMPGVKSAEDVLFPSPGLGVVVDYAGMGEVTAKLQAFSLQDGSALWHAEHKIGYKYQLLSDRVFYDQASPCFYLGNGPVTAIDPQSGAVKWCLSFKQCGVVRSIQPARDCLVAVGSDRDNAITNYEDLKKHFEKPKLFAIERESGQVRWAHEFSAPEDPGDVHAIVLPGSSGAEGSDPGERILLKGKVLELIAAADGRVSWRTEKSAFGAPLVLDDCVVLNIDRHLACLNVSDGTPRWVSQQKVERADRFVLAGADLLVALDPGEFKDGRYSGGYRIYGFDQRTGDLRWKYEDGSDFVDLASVSAETIVCAEQERYRTLDATSAKVLSESKRREDFGSGSWYLPDRVLEVGPKGVMCSAPNRQAQVWVAKLERAKRGGSFMMSMLKGLSLVMQSASSSGRATMYGGNSPRYMAEETMARREQEKATSAFAPKDLPRGVDAMWQPPFMTDAEYGTAALVDDCVVFPTNDKRIVALDVANGTVKWEVTTGGKTAWPFFAPDLSCMVVPEEGQASIYHLR